MILPDVYDLLSYLRSVEDVVCNICNSVEQRFEYQFQLYSSKGFGQQRFSIAIDPEAQTCVLAVGIGYPIFYHFWCGSITEVTAFNEQLTCYDKLSKELRNEFNFLIQRIILNLETKVAGQIIPALFYLDILHIN